jgi:hypothetical protein
VPAVKGQVWLNGPLKTEVELEVLVISEAHFILTEQPLKMQNPKTAESSTREFDLAVPSKNSTFENAVF